MHSTTVDEIPTIYVIDDQPQERENVAAVASTQGWHCQGFASAEQFFDLTKKNRPGCLILDYRLEDEHENGLEVLKRLNREVDALPTLVVTAYANVSIATEFMRCGAVTLLEKPYPQDKLVTNIRKAIKQDRQAQQQQTHMAVMARLTEQVTERQQKVIDLVLQGHMNKRIATILNVSQRTVENERAEILELYHVSNAVELATKVTEYRGYLAAQKHVID